MLGIRTARTVGRRNIMPDPQSDYDTTADHVWNVWNVTEQDDQPTGAPVSEAPSAPEAHARPADGTDAAGHDSGGGHGRGVGVALALGALGVVFGDIGTSPLYAIQTVFGIDNGAVRPTPGDVYGVISMVFWSIT